ncbi:MULTISPECIES: plasmid partitioning protein RepB [unclassified Rhizobium]|uniref:plasmid partitioning protein RepB n=1 Tax=unclassified Rhizobium TaxID=2613769 RepID=UPI001ADBC1DA|nr:MULTISPECIES: plasmid partitioning protein RepB [unclassified Rhizobium]MBO9127727.1 plasmid partitioning protein RepB [Rhizobium sp. 16-488-2b]MBO9178189.1 plasmid partitioning protein RepB [Rhizobium sp. 16-488-2a]
MSRKGIFAHLSEANQSGPSLPARPLAKPKAMATVTKSLGDLSSRSQRADELERILAEGQAVVDLDVSVIEPSFVQDRMPGDIDALKASILEQGQQVPILVRPLPDNGGRYQVAFGHRRLRALTELGLTVKAVVRDLSDEQLVIAQGQENNERQDLSFIEKARFAARLKERFGRDVIMSSMSIDKAHLSKMLSIIDVLPSELIDAIGPAHGIGLRSWQDLGALVQQAASPREIVDYATSRDISALPSPDRFKAVLARKSKPVVRGAAAVMSSLRGERLAQVKDSKAKLEITIDKKATPEFAAFVLEQLPALFEEHLTGQRKKEA